MNKKKSIVLVLSLALGVNTLPSVAESYIAKDNNISVTEMKSKCLPFDINKIQQAIQDKKQICFKNPFDETYNTPLSFNLKDEKLLSLSDFDNIKDVYEEYLNFVNVKSKEITDEQKVSQVYLSNNKVYKFVKFVADGKIMDQFKRAFRNTEMEGNEETFLFFHELMHLSTKHNHYFNKNVKESEVEAAADFAGTIMVSLKNNYDLDKTMALINDIEKIRKRPPSSFNSRLIRQNNDSHYNKSSFNNIRENLVSAEFIEELNYLRTLDFNKPEDFKRIIKIVDELSFNAQKLDKTEFIAFMKTKDNKLRNT